MPTTLKRKRQGEHGPPAKRGQKLSVGEAVEVDASNNVKPAEDSDNQDDESSSDEDDEEAVQKENAPEDTQRHSKKLPSANELRMINETSTLYKSNIFRAQLDLLLNRVRPQQSSYQSLERTLQKLYTHFTSLPSVSCVHPLEAADALPKWMPRKGKRSQPAPSVTVPYPLPSPPQDASWTVAFERPENMNVIGSWPNKLAVQTIDHAPFGVDVAVEMPAQLFQKKDYRDSRFFYKRAFYLACLATSILNSFPNFIVEYEATEGDLRLTTLLLSFRKNGEESDVGNHHASIRIIPVLSDKAPIPPCRLSPSQPNIRSVASTSQQETTHQVDSRLSTPRYNNSLALCFARISRTRLIASHKLLGMVPSFGDGLGLLRIWANQRGYGAGCVRERGNGRRNYCVRGFEGLGAWWACILEVLILGEEPVEDEQGKKKGQRPLVGKGLSSYQLFRAALDFLAKRDFQNEPVLMKVIEYGQRFALSDWKEQHEAVFVDATGMVNMLASVPACSLQLLRYDAANTLKLLNTPDDCFSRVFLMDLREPHARFDAVISVNLATIRHYASLDFPSTQAATLHNLILTVRKALNTRAHAVVALQPRSLPCDVTATQATSLSVLTLGIIFDPAHAPRLVDHGPPVSSPDVDAFRAFWGPKAELRRFKDGSILESCVWDEGIVRVEDREKIPSCIVRYILNLHFGVPENGVCVMEDYGRVVSMPSVRGRVESGYNHAIAAFNKLVKELKTLEDEGQLPLMLVSAKPCSPYLRYTSVFPPDAVPSASAKSMHPSTSYLPAFNIILQFERSSQWPDDLRAIQKVKLALFESIARGLSQRKNCWACVVLDQHAADIEDGCALEVILDGWAFHARVGHDREMVLLQDMLSLGAGTVKRPNRPTLSEQERQAAVHSLDVYRRRFIGSPAHHSAILALHHKYPAFSHAVRLVKRWLGAHWLSARVSEEAIELVCAKAFLGRGSGDGDEDVPATGKRGFVRVVEFLKGWDGVAYVSLYEAVRDGDANGDAAASTLKERTATIEAGKGSWRLMTAEDASGTMWCDGVSTPLAARIQDIAEATLACLTEGTPTFKPLFQHQADGYDFLIELEMDAVSRYWQGMGADPSAWTASGYVNLTYRAADNDEASPRVAFNPAEIFFRDLQRIYGDTVELFYDVYGGTRIGGVWNPSVVKSNPRQWRVFLGFSSMPVVSKPQHKKETSGIVFNMESVLLEIQRMGSGIVKRITTRKENAPASLSA